MRCSGSSIPVTSPDGMLLKACGSRRATVSRPCSEVYRADSWHLVAAGLRGGKGVPGSVDRHPRLFVTLTAPSFGAVHSRREIAGNLQPCAPIAGRCPHGVGVGAGHRHRLDDLLVGQPALRGLFRLRGRRPVERVGRRALAADDDRHPAPASPARRRTRPPAAHWYGWPSPAVVEYQARGLVHVHAVLRSGRASPCKRQMMSTEWVSCIPGCSV